jgi:3,4-dihydroxy 2-butanone 4-phosphate synthase/GTP cyclohydrolase II
VFPLVSKTGGVLIRSGHTEAATDLCRVAGLEEVGVLAEVVNDDGTVKRLPQLLEFAREHGLKIVSIADLIEHRMRTESVVKRIETFSTATPIGEAVANIYTTPFDETQHLAVVFGSVDGGRVVPCRIHHEQPLRDLLQSPRSQRWLDNALARFQTSGGGMIITSGPEDHQPGDHQRLAPRRRAPTGMAAPAPMERWREVGWVRRSCATSASRRSRCLPRSAGSMSAWPASASRSRDGDRGELSYG